MSTFFKIEQRPSSPKRLTQHFVGVYRQWWTDTGSSKLRSGDKNYGVFKKLEKICQRHTHRDHVDWAAIQRDFEAWYQNRGSSKLRKGNERYKSIQNFGELISIAQQTTFLTPAQATELNLSCRPGFWKIGEIYCSHPLEPQRMVPFREVDEILEQERATQLLRLLCALGAQELRVTSKRSHSSLLKAAVSGGIPFFSVKGHHETRKRFSKSRDVFFRFEQPDHFRLAAQPRLPWLALEENWKSLVQMRLGANKLSTARMRHETRKSAKHDTHLDLRLLGMFFKLSASLKVRTRKHQLDDMEITFIAPSNNCKSHACKSCGLQLYQYDGEVCLICLNTQALEAERRAFLEATRQMVCLPAP